MIAEEVLLQSKILIVDDNPCNVMVLERMLDWAGYKNLKSTLESTAAVTLYQEYRPDLVILDLHMPNMSGFEVLESLKRLSGSCFVPILVFTADMTGPARDKALALGASDFLTKPGDAMEISLRVHNFLQTHHLNREIEQKNAELEQKVAQRTMDLWTSQIEILERLARASQLRQNSESDRPKKIGEISAEIARILGWDPTRVELLRLAAPLHDIGNLTVPDAVLQKAARLTEEEQRLMRSHTTAGADVFAGGRTPLVIMAEAIARYHHERWDGDGYPDGLIGEAIPAEARIVAVADSLLTLLKGNNCWRGLKFEDALDDIAAGSGRRFDPQVIQAFLVAFKRPSNFLGNLAAA